MIMTKILIIASNFLLATSASIIQTRTNLVRQNDRVVGGQDAEIGQFPWMASLRTNGGSHFCGGTIINAQWILTAAHCVRSKEASSLTAIVGIVNLEEDGVSYPVSRIISHPDYSSSTSKDDIALLLLASPLSFDKDVRAIRLEEEDVEEVDCVLIGWGRTASTGSISDHLQYVKTRTLPLEDCLDYWTGNKVGGTHVCALTARGEGACNGDSGGPLVFEGKQIGIVSWGSPCANGYPDVYTRVSSYVGWIEENLILDPFDFSLSSS